jgi:hypothetical protein
LRVRNISTIFGRCERGWRELWAQSCVSGRAGTVSVDETPEASFLLKKLRFCKNTRNRELSEFSTSRVIGARASPGDVISKIDIWAEPVCWYYNTSFSLLWFVPV